MRLTPLLSLVIPVYNEQPGLPLLFAEVERVCGQLDYEVVLVDDGSTDGSWGLIAEQSRRNPRFRGLRLSRNFGHQLALTAGLDVARGGRRYFHGRRPSGPARRCTRHARQMGGRV
jgi:dolichol-phosphate mannosyltransferase